MTIDCTVTHAACIDDAADAHHHSCWIGKVEVVAQYFGVLNTAAWKGCRTSFKAWAAHEQCSPALVVCGGTTIKVYVHVCGPAPHFFLLLIIQRFPGCEYEG